MVEITDYRAYFCPGKDVLVAVPMNDGGTYFHQFDGSRLWGGTPCRDVPWSWSMGARQMAEYVAQGYKGFQPLAHLVNLPIVLAEMSPSSPQIPIGSVSARLPQKGEDIFRLPEGKYRSTLWSLPSGCFLDCDDLYNLVRTVFGVLTVDEDLRVFLGYHNAVLFTHLTRLVHARYLKPDLDKETLLASYVDDHRVTIQYDAVYALARAFLKDEGGDAATAWIERRYKGFSEEYIASLSRQADDLFFRDPEFVSLRALNRARPITAEELGRI